MFDKILIANRGEIACRVIRTAQRLGIRTVAVYSDADAGARHVAMADEAFRIGPPPARESYLQAGGHRRGRPPRAARSAIHPGYGFLSENAEFAEACAAGRHRLHRPARRRRSAPWGRRARPSASWRRPASRWSPATTARTRRPERLARRGGAHRLPGADQGDAPAAAARACGRWPTPAPSPTRWPARAARRWRPSATTACSSSGTWAGRATSRCRSSPTRTGTPCTSSSATARSSGVTRRCSRRRRRPGSHRRRREAMGRAAVAAARAIGYVGAGTVEFLLDEDGRFYFMEMNTRLQVEHPVTEMITGQDLVEWQLRVAAGEPLPLRAGGARHHRPRHRGAGLRRGPRPRLPAVDRRAGAPAARPASRRTSGSTPASARATRSPSTTTR